MSDYAECVLCGSEEELTDAGDGEPLCGACWYKYEHIYDERYADMQVAYYEGMTIFDESAENLLLSLGRGEPEAPAPHLRLSKPRLPCPIEGAGLPCRNPVCGRTYSHGGDE